MFPTSNLRSDEFSLPEGTVTVSWPASLSADSAEEVKAYLDILKRKIGRVQITKPKEPMKIPYPSLYSAQRSALDNAWKQSLHPRVAEIMLIQSTADANHRVLNLCEQAAADGIVVDEALVLGRYESVESVMGRRVAAGVPVYGYKLAEVPKNEIKPISTNPADFPPFELAAHIAGGGKGPRQLWIQDPTQSGPLFSPGIDSTAYPVMIAQGMTPNGNPRQAFNILTEYQTDQPGFNGAIVRTDSVYGYRVPFGQEIGPGETESRWRILQNGQFERYDKVDS